MLFYWFLAVLAVLIVVGWRTTVSYFYGHPEIWWLDLLLGIGIVILTFVNPVELQILYPVWVICVGSLWVCGVLLLINARMEFKQWSSSRIRVIPFSKQEIQTKKNLSDSWVEFLQPSDGKINKVYSRVGDQIAIVSTQHSSYLIFLKRPVQKQDTAGTLLNIFWYTIDKREQPEMKINKFFHRR